jgi:hypothetical protein
MPCLHGEHHAAQKDQNNHLAAVRLKIVGHSI